MNAGKYILIALAIIVVIGIVKNMSGKSDGSNATQIENEYSTEWASPSSEEIAKISNTFVKNNVTGCGQFFVKKKNRTNSEYAIACTSDGKAFKYYLAWPNIEEVKSIEDDGITKPYTRQ